MVLASKAIKAPCLISMVNLAVHCRTADAPGVSWRCGMTNPYVRKLGSGLMENTSNIAAALLGRSQVRGSSTCWDGGLYATHELSLFKCGQSRLAGTFLEFYTWLRIW